MPANKAADAPEWVALAVFAQPHGVSGRIKVKSFTDPADAFADNQILTDPAGRSYKLRITGHTQGMTIVEVEGITDRNAADLLRGRKIGIARTALPQLENPDAYYTDDLIGMQVLAEDGSSFGSVKSVANYGASDILDITRVNGESELYAFTHAIFPTVDLAQRRITIVPPVILNAREDGDESA